MTARKEVRKGDLVRIDWSGEDFPVYSQVLIHKDKHITAANEGVLELIRAMREEDRNA